MSREQAKSNKERRQFWQMVIETWQDSGMSVSKFCKAEGLSEGTFYSWRKRLSGRHSQRNKQTDSSSSAFIEVAMPKSDHAALELLLSSGNTLRISSTADNKTLSNVIYILRQAGLCWLFHHPYEYSYTLSLRTCVAGLTSSRCSQIILWARIHSAVICLSTSISEPTSARYFSGTGRVFASGTKGLNKVRSKESAIPLRPQVLRLIWRCYHWSSKVSTYPMSNSVSVTNAACMHKACHSKIFCVFQIFFLLIFMSLLHCHHRYGWW